MRRSSPGASRKGCTCYSSRSGPASPGHPWSSASSSADMNIVLLFPGQGSQKPGMGKDLAEAFPVARGVFGEVDAALGADISRFCFEGPADQLTATNNAQPALFAHAAAVWALVKDAVRPHVRAAAGHSLGEFSAYHAADTVSLPGAAVLVRRRGELMYETGNARPGTMAAILGATTTPIA